MKRFFYIAAIVLLSILFLLTTLLFTTLRVMNSSWGKQKMIDMVQPFISADLSIQEISVSVFRHFPAVVIDVKKGALTVEQDTLLSFDRLAVGANWWTSLSQNTIVIDSLVLERPYISVLQTEEGLLNWDVFVTDTTSVQDTTPLSIPDIHLRRFNLNRAHLLFESQKEKIYLRCQDLSFETNDAQVKGEKIFLPVHLSLAKLSYLQSKTADIRDIPLALTTEIHTDLSFKEVDVRSFNLESDSLSCQINGTFKEGQYPGMWDTKMALCLSVNNIQSLLGHFVSVAKISPSQYIGNGKIGIKANMDGPLGKGVLPRLKGEMVIAGLSAGIRNTPYKVDELTLKSALVFNPDNGKDNFVSVDSLRFMAGKSKLSGKISVKDFLRSQKIQFDIHGRIDLDYLKKLSPVQTDNTISGDFSVNLDGDFSMADVKAKKISQIKTNGEVRIQHLFLKFPAKETELFVNNALITTGTNRQSRRDSSKNILFQLRGSFDSLRFCSKKDVCTAASKIVFSTHASSLRGDVPSMHIAFSTSGFETLLYDTTRIYTKKSSAVVAITKDKNDPLIPSLKLRWHSDSLIFTTPSFACLLDSTGIQTNVNPRLRRYKRVAGERVLIDNATRHPMDLDSLYHYCLNLSKTNDPSGEFLKKFNSSGDFYMRLFRFNSPYFSLPARVRRASMSFTDDTVRLKNITFRVGRSNLKLSGDLYNVRRTLLGRGVLKGEAQMTSRRIDLNQILGAMYAGSQLKKSDLSADRTDLALNNAQALEKAENIESNGVEDSSQIGLFVVPRFLDVSLKTSIDSLLFANVKMRDFKGLVEIKNQTLDIENLATTTDIGSIGMDFMYQCRNRSIAKAGANIRLDQIQVEELVKALPLLDTIVPMLRSFEGDVSCSMTALADLDSLMDIQLPTLNAACQLKGYNMVLLDGETFTEIAKMLMFKNKKRNVIDSISVEMVVRNNKMEILPFMLQMDRYKAAIGGDNTFDFDFNYHISVLKSPLPFKIGLDVYGNLDKFKFRLTSPKYKDETSVTKRETFLNQKINIREELQLSLQKLIREASVNALSTQERNRRRTNNDGEK